MSQLTVEKEFTEISQIQDLTEGLAKLTGSKIISIYVQGQFKIPYRSMWTNELNLDHGWYKVKLIGRKYLTISVPGHGEFKAKPSWGKHYVRLISQHSNILIRTN